MKIGLVSDSFGNLDALTVAFDVFARAEAERVFFLGGWWADVDAVLARRRFGASAEPGTPGAASDPQGGDFLAAVRGALSRAAAVPEHPLAGKVTRVASRACPEAGAGASRKVVDLVEGRICCLVHDKAELTRDDIGNASVLFHGNSGKAGMVQIGPRVFVTPGHLRTPSEDGRPASFALVELGATELILTVYGGDGTELRTERAPLGGGGGKVSVR